MIAKLSVDDKKARTRAIIRKLKKRFPDAKCSLTFRSPLQLLVATILSAQCTDVRVNIVTKDLFKRYTRAPILLGHSGAGSNGAEIYVKYAKKYPNLYLELCFSRAPYGVIEYFVSEVGAERVLWGSDAPAMAISQQLGRILFADITDDDKKTIMVVDAEKVATRDKV